MFITNRNYGIYIFFLLIFNLVSAQEEEKTYTAIQIDDSPTIDGILDDKVWNKIESKGNFIQYFPSDYLDAKYSTEFKIAYSKTTLYIAFKVFYENEKIVVSSLKRDFRAMTNDNVTVLFDTFSDGSNAFFFGVTPYGVKREGLVSQGGTNFNNNWDIKWQAEAKRFPEYYTVEMAIPFSSLKFIEGTSTWRFRPYRFNIQSNEQSTWVKIPKNQSLGSLAYMGVLKFENPLGKSRSAIAIIPFLNGKTEKDFSLSSSDTNLKVGGDAKIAVGDGINLDITVNPDFSNVEVDDIFTNLTRFELRLPEKRQFFIDNNDLFDTFGNYFSGAKPFFSRRIGLVANKDGDLIENDIIAGARLSGKLNEDWRLGFFSIQTARDEKNEIASFNNLMATVQRKVGDRSNIGIFMINRQATGNESFLSENELYNRVIGADYNLASANNVFRGRFYLHKSFQPRDQKRNLSGQAVFFYNPRKWLMIADIAFVDSGFSADLGFVPRDDIVHWGVSSQRILYPKKTIFNTHRLMFLFIQDHKQSLNFKKIDHFYNFRYQVEFRNQARAHLFLTNYFTFLIDSFDPTGEEGAIPLPQDTSYYYNQLEFNFQSSNTKLFTYGINLVAGGFFNGNILSISADLNYRIQPRANIGIKLGYDGINLPHPFSDADLLLLTSNIEITFSKKLFWNTLIQYRSQSENLGINTRLQWRFAPLSDLHLVYNDNYLTTNSLLPRFRSINLKLTYWLNL